MPKGRVALFRQIFVITSGVLKEEFTGKRGFCATKARLRPGNRDSFIHDMLFKLDPILELLIYFMLVFSVWAFGTTEAWSLRVMFQCSLGLCVFLVFDLASSVYGIFAHRRKRIAFPWELVALNIAFLVYTWLSIWNARAIYDYSTGAFIYLPHLAWLPATYDLQASQNSLRIYFGLTVFFWTVRGWILRSPFDSTDCPECFSRGYQLPARLSRLITVIVVNGAALALEAIIQRSSNTSKLLWLVEPRIHKEAISQFGPYAYRSNAAQYLNMIWPVAVSVAWVCWKRSQITQTRRFGFKMFVPLGLASIAGVIISVSRGSILAMGIMMGGLLFYISRWSKSWSGKRIILPGLSVLLVLGLLSWIVLPQLVQRLADTPEASTMVRKTMYESAFQMAKEYPFFGTGPGSFEVLFQLYRKSDKEFWPAQLHNDWMEYFITWGGVGLLISVTMFIRALWGTKKKEACFYLKPCLSNGLLISIGGCLLQAMYDFPLQIYSIQLLFVGLCAIASVLTVDKAKAISDQ
ncbi:MAG: polymerase [Verrucomicrobiales bacterium]|nr:polymerase [Verrucomicrobiales bacterium]